jgi:RHS repeat-associated protein
LALATDTLRGQHAYTYSPNAPTGVLVSGTATVTRAGVPGTTYRSVGYDHRGRQTTSTDAAGLITKTYWDSNDQQVATEGPDGLVTATYYNQRHQPTEVWGPAPKTWFDWYPVFGTQLPIPNPTYRAQIPLKVTNYDEGITGTQVEWWTGTTAFAGIPKAHTNDPGELRNSDFADRPTGVAADGISVRYTGDITFPAIDDFHMQICAGPGDVAYAYIDDRLVGSTSPFSPPIDPAGDTCSDRSLASAIVHSYSPGERHTVRVDYSDLGQADLVHLNWDAPSVGWTAVSTLTAGYSLPTSTVDADHHTTSTQYSDTTTGIGPQHGLVTKTIVDPAGLALTDTTEYEPATDATKYLRRLSHTLPAGTGSKTTSSYYTDTQAVANPCLSGSPSINQGGLGRFDTATDPDGGGSQTAIVRESIYDTLGRTVGSRIGSETWTCTTYDSRGRVTKVDYPAYGGQAARTVTTNYTVDPDGAGSQPANPLISSVTDPAGTVTTQTDVLGRVVAYTDVWGNATTYVYDQAGRQTTTTGPAGTITNTYDNADRLTAVSRNTQTVATVSYDPATGRTSSIGYPSGTGNAGNGTTGTIGYDTYGRLASLTWTGPAAALITKDEVGRSLSGDIVDQRTDGNDHHTGTDYIYDAAGRLTEAWTPVPAGGTIRHICYEFGTTTPPGCGAATVAAVTAGRNTNRTRQIIESGATTTYTYDNADRLTNSSDATVGTVAYDSHGNTTSIFGETHTYDAADRHISTTKAGTTVAYTRDATDRIVARKVGATTIARYGTTGPGDTADFTTNTANQIQEVTLTLPGGALLTTRAAGNVWSYPNLHGDIVATTNQAGTKQGPTRTYDPYGNLIAGTTPDDSAGNLDYAWLGQHQRPLETEPTLQPTIEMGARQYSPILGRFLEVDPIEGGSANDYDYVSGDPIGSLDLGGTFCLTGKNKNGSCRSIARHLGRVKKTYTNFYARNRSTLATIGAIAVCATPGVNVAGCAVASAAAFAVRAQHRGRGHTRENVKDGLLTAFGFGFGASAQAATSSNTWFAATGIGSSYTSWDLEQHCHLYDRPGRSGCR